MHNIKIPDKNKLLSLFNIIACSISKNFDNFQQRLSYTMKIQVTIKTFEKKESIIHCNILRNF